MVLVEALVHQQETGRIQRPTLLLGVTLIVLGLAARLADHESLATPRVARDRRRHHGGQEVLPALLGALARDRGDSGQRRTQAYVIARDGREHRFDLEDLAAPADIRQALLAAQTRWQTPLPPNTV